MSASSNQKKREVGSCRLPVLSSAGRSVFLFLPTVLETPSPGLHFLSWAGQNNFLLSACRSSGQLSLLPTLPSPAPTSLSHQVELSAPGLSAIPQPRFSCTPDSPELVRCPSLSITPWHLGYLPRVCLSASESSLRRSVRLTPVLPSTSRVTVLRPLQEAAVSAAPADSHVHWKS